jgi:hypothetical protein
MVAKGAFCVFAEHDHHPDGNRKVESEEGGVAMRKWMGIPLALLLMIGLHASAWANSEAHTGGRLFFPLWDVTNGRLTFIIITREAMREGASIEQVRNQWRISGNPGKCLPRGANGSTTNVNRTDLGGTAANPVFVDDVHFEYYGRSCFRADEIVHMSCGDTDLFVLASPDNVSIKPRSVFDLVAGEGSGALDVHFTTNGQLFASNRKLENSLMGHAIIADLAEGWTASYDAAVAKAVSCPSCEQIDGIDGGTAVGYENYPTEVYLPFALADNPSSGFENRLALWAPALLPGGIILNTAFAVEIRWWDGRERSFITDRQAHSIIEPLKTLDPKFDVANFVCGHTADPTKAENDGFPRSGTDATACGAPTVADPEHKSDNFEAFGDTNVLGHSIQPSTPMGWWRFNLIADTAPPPLNGPNSVRSGRGLVGVVLSSTSGSGTDNLTSGMGYATRLWHEDPCEIAQSGGTIGPPHKGHGQISDQNVALFNTFNLQRQKILCGLIRRVPFPFDFPGDTFEQPQ